MRWNCDVRHNRKLEWHSWFAWCPTRVGPGDCRWLERIERKGTFHCNWAGTYWDWEYRG